MSTPSALKRKRQSDGTLSEQPLPSSFTTRHTGAAIPSSNSDNVTASKTKSSEITSIASTVGTASAQALQHSSDHTRHEQQLPAQECLSEASRDDSDVEGEDDEENDDLLEDVLDQVELEPYPQGPHNESTISTDDAANLRKRLHEVDLHQFLDETTEVPPRDLGSIFGIDPTMEIPDELYLSILVRVLMREQMRRQKLHHVNTIDDAASLLASAQRIIVITGAGISTSLGIPDFRSKGTGFYDKIRSMGYEGGEDVFDIEMFDQDPSIFYSLAGDILPDQKRFTPTHAFLRLIQDQGRLQTNYTQNIDNLEALAGVSRDKLIQCHGSFATATCRKCKHQVPGEDIHPEIRARQVAQCKKCIETLTAGTATVAATGSSTANGSTKKWTDASSDEDDDAADDIPTPGIMKPDITFFGEQLPSLFFDRFSDVDAATTDLILVIGTSLKVAPVSDMCNHVPENVPQIYISREPVEHHYFDVQLLGDCDAVVWELCRRAGWTLTHEMIPDDMEVAVRPVENHLGRWTVSRIAPALHSGKEVTGGEEDEKEGATGASANTTTTVGDVSAIEGTE